MGPTIPPSILIPESAFPFLREYLVRHGFVFEDRPHQVFLARGKGAVVNLYQSGKVVIGGSSPVERSQITTFVQSLAAPPAVEKAVLQQTVDSKVGESTREFHGTRVGMDEAGKGDYFGPLVTCAVLSTEAQAEQLRQMGVRDSKRFPPNAIIDLATKIRQTLPKDQWRVVKIPPTRYNILYAKMENLNRLLGWAHARGLEDVLVSNSSCKTAVADQFGDPRFIQDALFRRGRQIDLIQIPKAESDVVVAAASILARDEFVLQMKLMRARFDLQFPLGASNVEEFARALVARHGPEALLDTAKVHFSTTARVVPDVAPLHEAIRQRLLAEK